MGSEVGRGVVVVVGWAVMVTVVVDTITVAVEDDGSTSE